MFAEGSMKMEASAASAHSTPVLEPANASALKTAICQETAACCVKAYGAQLRALVLTGSAARNEATFIEEEERFQLLSDAEFFLIFNDHVPLPSNSAVASLRQAIEDKLSGRAVNCHVQLDAAHPRYLHDLQPHILAYELRTCGQVVWGDSEVLSLIPAFAAKDIPLEDAWRLLANRIVEQLEIADELFVRQPTMSRESWYRTNKLYLDMATSLLVFAGHYSAAYESRSRTLLQIAAEQKGDWPFPLSNFAVCVRDCTNSKLHPESRGVSASWDFWLEAVGYAHRLWDWELRRMWVGANSSQAPASSAWLSRQPLTARVRGWMNVLRRSGWHRSWRSWPQWGRMFLGSSPRYWVYSVASELFFALPTFAGIQQGPSPDLEALAKCLPGVSTTNFAGPRWRELCHETLWNYNEFLTNTRS